MMSDNTIIALAQQIGLTESHIDRVQAKQDRYKHGCVAWWTVGAELAYWRDLLEILVAVNEGKTVQPS